MRLTSRADRDAEEGERDRVDPTVRWLVHGAWRIAVVAIAILLVVNLVVELSD